MILCLVVRIRSKDWRPPAKGLITHRGRKPLKDGHLSPHLKAVSTPSSQVCSQLTLGYFQGRKGDGLLPELIPVIPKALA